MGKIQQINIICIAGKTYKFDIPRTLENFKGYFPLSGSAKIEDSSGSILTKSTTNGFVVENEDVGEIVGTSSDPNEIAVLYKHKYSADNSIWFFAETGERLKISVNGSIDIHDHASITTGGPAYGTYYSQSTTGGTP